MPEHGLAPALTGSCGFAATLNLGSAAFAFGPPDDTYVSVQWALGPDHSSLTGWARCLFNGGPSRKPFRKVEVEVEDTTPAADSSADARPRGPGPLSEL